MSTSQAVAQHLPYLRRYARALSGSQPSGDAYVAATLEALLEDPKILETGASTRIALYRLFTKIWNSVALNGKPAASEANQPVERHLAQIAPMPRQAFLLVALEGLSEDDAAKVLDGSRHSRSPGDPVRRGVNRARGSRNGQRIKAVLDAHHRSDTCQCCAETGPGRSIERRHDLLRYVQTHETIAAKGESLQGAGWRR